MAIYPTALMDHTPNNWSWRSWAAPGPNMAAGLPGSISRAVLVILRHTTQKQAKELPVAMACSFMSKAKWVEAASSLHGSLGSPEPACTCTR